METTPVAMGHTIAVVGLFAALAPAVTASAAQTPPAPHFPEPLDTTEQHTKGNTMSVQFLNPEGLLQSVPYHHVSVATGSRHVHVAGQIAWDADGQVVAPGDLTGQTAQALRNTSRALAGADATLSDVVRLRFFVTDWTPDKIGAFLAGVEQVADELGLPQPLPPTSLIGVDILNMPEYLIEVEAYAVLD